MAPDTRILQLINRFAAAGPHMLSLDFHDAIVEALVVVFAEIPEGAIAYYIGRAVYQMAHERVELEGASDDNDPDLDIF